MIIVIIGVTGSGKTTVGKALAQALGWNFYDGDEFHSRDNIAKMRRGLPLVDEDRGPWLNSIREAIGAALDRGENAVFACSALKQSYRDILAVSSAVAFIYLGASISLARARVQNRTGHFIHPGLVESQFEILEEPRNALRIDARLPVTEIVRLIRARWAL